MNIYLMPEQVVDHWQCSRSRMQLEHWDFFTSSLEIIAHSIHVEKYFSEVNSTPPKCEKRNICYN